MKLEQIKNNYEKEKEAVEKSFLQNFGEYLKQIFPNVKNFTFSGDDECYNDEDYYTDLEDFLVDGKSLRKEISICRPFYEFIFPGKVTDWNPDDLYTEWEDIKDFLKDNCPTFIQEKDITYKLK